MAQRNIRETWGNNHPRMPIAERAKQFMPFAAVGGVSSAMREKERILIAKPTLGEDQTEEINRTLADLRRGDRIAVYYFKACAPDTLGETVMLCGSLQKLDPKERLIRLSDMAIPFDDVISLEKLDGRKEAPGHGPESE